MPDSLPRKRGDDMQKALRGSIWTLGGYGGSQILRLGSNLILARLLFPEAFGLMSLVNVFMQGLQMFSDIGIGPGIIQSKSGERPEYLRAAWTLQVIRGFALWFVTLALAWPLAQFFAAGNPDAGQLAVLLPVTGLTALIGGFTSTSVFRFNRQLKMARITLLELLPQAVSLLVMIGAAWIWPSTWALVWGGLAFSLVRLALSHVWNDGPRDGFGWDPAARRELVRFGRWIFLSTIVSFLATHLDRILLGRLLTMAELGLYSIGMTFARVAINTASRLGQTILFPLLSRRQDDPPRLIRSCLKARRAILWAGGVVCVAFAIGAPFFFDTLYDERYRQAGVISRWLALYTWSFVLMASMDRIPLALGQPRRLFEANVLATLGMLVAVAGQRFFGLPGFIVGMAASQVLAHVFLVWSLPTGRWAMLAQSGLATAGCAAYALPAMWVLAQLEPRLGTWGYGALVAAVAGLPVPLAVGQVRAMMKKKTEAA